VTLARGRYKYAQNFEKFAELLVQAVVCCIPLPHQYGAPLDAGGKGELEQLRAEVAQVLKFEVGGGGGCMVICTCDVMSSEPLALQPQTPNNITLNP